MKAQARRDVLLRVVGVLQQRRDELSKRMVNGITAREGWAGYNVSSATGMAKEVI